VKHTGGTLTLTRPAAATLEPEPERAAPPPAKARMTSEETDRRIAARVENLAIVRKRWPLAFDIDRPLPLALGIDKAIEADLGIPAADVSSKSLCRGTRACRQVANFGALRRVSWSIVP
jgi:hypothetical protein